jgi:hypothetical protein
MAYFTPRSTGHRVTLVFLGLVLSGWGADDTFDFGRPWPAGVPLMVGGILNVAIAFRSVQPG